MPTYGYQCTECKHEFSVFQAMKDDPLTKCPECTGSIKRILYPVGVIFKGSGWYVNDSRKPDKSSGEAETGTKAESEKPAEAKPAEATTAAETKQDIAPNNKPTANDSKPAATGG